MQDAGDLISVYVDRDYAAQYRNWVNLRVIIDIGATVGCFTIWVGRLAPQAQIIAVEPNPDVYPYLVENLSKNGMLGRVVPTSAAVGGEKGFGSLEQNAFTTLVSLKPLGQVVGPTVRVVDLEGLLEETGVSYCDLLKLDCEGSEFEILLSASDATLNRVGALICEYHPRSDFELEDLVQRLHQCGFSVEIDRGPVGFLRARRLDGI